MAHSNSFPTLITVSQQMNQSHFQQSVTSQMQPTAVVNSHIVFPQCPQPLSIQHGQNSAMATVSQVNNSNANVKTQMQHGRSFQQQQHPQLTIPVQLGSGNHAFTTTGIPLDLSYLVQSGCLPHCVPIQLTGPNGLQPSFQAALSCVSAPSPLQNEPTANNSFLQFANVSLSYPQCQQSQTVTTQPPPSTPQKPAAKRRKKPIVKTDKTVTDRFQSVAVQTDFDMSLCRQQIVVVPPKNCTCGAVAKAVASGSFQAASFPPRKTDKRNKRIKMDSDNDDDQLQPQQLQTHQTTMNEQQCNGSDNNTIMQASCDNRGRPFTYECLYCPKKFSLHSRLVAHLRCHTGMRPFSCLQCGYSFTQRSYLNRHAAVHKQERPFTCLSCHKTYKHYGSLANHRKLHTKDSSDKSVTISESADPLHHVSLTLNNPSLAVAAPCSSSTGTTHTSSSHLMYPVPVMSSTSSSASSLFQVASSSLSHPLPPSQQQQQQPHFPVMSTTGSTNTQLHYPLAAGSQLFPSSQTLAAFYPGHDGQGFLLSLNPSGPSSAATAAGSSAANSTMASNTMLLQLHPHYASTSHNTLPSNTSSSSAYVPVMSAPAFS